MAIKKILTYPNPVLRQRVETVTNFDDSLKELARDLAETMYDAPGVLLLMFLKAKKKRNP
jgi:peptide deformylase